MIILFKEAGQTLSYVKWGHIVRWFRCLYRSIVREKTTHIMQFKAMGVPEGTLKDVF